MTRLRSLRASVYTRPVAVVVIILVAAIIVVALLTSCGAGTNPEVYSDAEVGDRDTTSAKIIEMPDGFSNVATKCVDGNQIYVIFRNKASTGNFGSVAVVPGCATEN